MTDRLERRQSDRKRKQIARLMQQNSQLQEVLLQLADNVQQDCFPTLTSDTEGAIRMRTLGIIVTRPIDASMPAGGMKDPNPVKLASDTCLIVSRP